MKKHLIEHQIFNIDPVKTIIANYLPMMEKKDNDQINFIRELSSFNITIPKALFTLLTHEASEKLKNLQGNIDHKKTRR